MTKEQIIELVRDELADNGITYYSTDDLSDSYDDGLTEVAVATGIIERRGSVALIDDQVYYDLYEALPDYLQVFAIWNPDIQDWMNQKSIDFFKRFRADWEKATGSSYRFAIVNFQTIALFPHKPTADGTELDIYYNAVPRGTQLMSSVPEIPEQFQVVLQYYQMSDLFAQAEEFTKANIYFKEYMNKRDELKHYVNNRSMPDRIHLLREQFSGGSSYGE